MISWTSQYVLFVRKIHFNVLLIHQKTTMFKYVDIPVLCKMSDHLIKMILQYRESIYQV